MNPMLKKVLTSALSSLAVMVTRDVYTSLKEYATKEEPYNYTLSKDEFTDLMADIQQDQENASN